MAIAFDKNVFDIHVANASPSDDEIKKFQDRLSQQIQI